MGLSKPTHPKALWWELFIVELSVLILFYLTEWEEKIGKNVFWVPDFNLMQPSKASDLSKEKKCTVVKKQYEFKNLKKDIKINWQVKTTITVIWMTTMPGIYLGRISLKIRANVIKCGALKINAHQKWKKVLQ